MYSSHSYPGKQVIFTLLLTGILLLTCCHPSQNSEEDNSFRFIFMTDIHVQDEKEGAEGFSAAVSHINGLAPDFVITGGDLIMDALRPDFSRVDSLYHLYDSIVSKLEMPVYNTLGNHEILGWSDKSNVPESHPEYGKEMFRKRIGKSYYSFVHKGWHFLILDSVEKGDTTTYKGEIDSGQMAWIQEELEGISPEAPLVVCVHIPFYSMATQLSYGVMASHSAHAVIHNANEVLELFGGYNLKLVLQGHMHILEAIYVRDTWFLTGGAVSGGWWSGPWDGTEEGFLEIRAEGDEFTWEYVDYGWEAAEYEEEW